jgi:fission process protein 1
MPWWGKSQEPKDAAESKRESQDAKSSFNPDRLPPKQKLPKALQKIVDKSDEDGSFFDDVVEG